MFKAKFGMNDILKDRVSGYKGQVMGITFYETGCTHYGLAPLKVKDDGSVATWEWFDESRMVFVKHTSRESTEPSSGPDMNRPCK